VLAPAVCFSAAPPESTLWAARRSVPEGLKLLLPLPAAVAGGAALCWPLGAAPLMLVRAWRTINQHY
jgi:hypothetical protein